MWYRLTPSFFEFMDKFKADISISISHFLFYLKVLEDSSYFVFISLWKVDLVLKFSIGFCLTLLFFNFFQVSVSIDSFYAFLYFLNLFFQIGQCETWLRGIRTSIKNWWRLLIIRAHAIAILWKIYFLLMKIWIQVFFKHKSSIFEGGIVVTFWELNHLRIFLFLSMEIYQSVYSIDFANQLVDNSQ